MLFKLKDFNKIFGLILIISLLGACSASKVEKATGSSVATFFVDQVEGTSQITKIDSTYAIPKTRLYNFKACIKDIMQSRPILGQSFKVQGGESEKMANTDEQGCLNWSESIDYNFLAQANYIQSSRTIVANGIHKGSANIQIAINPWSHGEDTSGVIDPNKKTISTLIVDDEEVSSALVAPGIRSPLWATNPRVSIIEKEFTAIGVAMALKFQTKLSLYLKNTAFQNVSYPIMNGVFDVEMILYNSITENGKEILTPLASSTLTDVSFTQDTLIADFFFNLNVLPTRGQILMGIRISAPGNLIGIDPFESIYMVSNNSSTKIEGIPTPVLKQSFGEVKNKLFVEKSQVSPAVKKELTQPGIEIDKLDIKFLKIGSENTTDRQVFFNIKACMRSNLDGRPIRDEKFIVKTVSGKAPVTIKSNQEGCISWDDFVWHKYFGKEHYLKSSIAITNQGFNLQKSISILVNPWEPGTNFGRDGRFVENLGSMSSNPSSKKAQISFENYSFSAANYKYEINKNLDLSLTKKGILSLSAKVINHSSLSEGRMNHESLRDGQYILKWAVITVNQDDKADSVINLGQKSINSFGGDLRTDIDIKVTAFEKLNIRSRLVVALYTTKEGKSKAKILEIDRNSDLEATPYFSTIVLNNDQDSQKMQRAENNLGLGGGDLFDRLKDLSAKNSKFNEVTDMVLSVQNLKKINTANEKESLSFRDSLANPNKYFIQTQQPAYYHEAQQKAALNSSILTSFAKAGKLTTELATSFCAFWFNDHLRRIATDKKSALRVENLHAIMTRSCIDAVKSDPAIIFSVDKKIMVKKVGSIKYLAGTTTNLNVGNTFNVSHSDTTTKSQTWSWSNSIGLSFDFLSIFKVGSSASYAVSSAKSKADAVSNSMQINASTYLFMQTNTFDIEITSYEECSSIRLSPELFAGKNARFGTVWKESMESKEMAKVATSGFFICTGVNNNAPIVKRENYYLISQDSGHNYGAQDGHAIENHQFFMTFRGKQDLLRFLSLTQSSLKLSSSDDSLNKNTSDVGSNLMKIFSMLPTWPGAYSDLN